MFLVSTQKTVKGTTASSLSCCKKVLSINYKSSDLNNALPTGGN